MNFVDTYTTDKLAYDIIRTREDIDDVVISEIKFSHQLGTVRAYLVAPVPIDSAPAVHFIHWLETDASDSNKDQFLPYAINLAKQGYVSILPDCFWAVDKHEFEEDPKKVIANWWKTEFTHDSQLCRKQLHDLMMTHDILLSIPGIDPDRIALVAHDFGAMFGSLLPALGRSYKIYVLMAATTRFSDWFRFFSKLTEHELQSYIEEMDFLDPLHHLQHLSGSKLLQFANDDFYVPLNKAKEFRDATHGDADFMIYEAKHGLNDQSFSDMYNWLLANL